MKTQSALLPSIGAFLALLLFVALPSPTARASQGQCPDVEVEVYYDGYHQIYLELEAGNGCDIYVTTAIDSEPVNPSRSGATPISPTMKVASGATFYVPYGHTLCIKAFCYKPLWTQSVNTIYFCLSNP